MRNSIMQIPVLSDPKTDNLLNYKNNRIEIMHVNRIGRKYGNLVGHADSLFYIRMLFF